MHITIYFLVPRRQKIKGSTAEPQIKMTNCLKDPYRGTETLELSKRLNQALCFGNILVLVRDWGRKAESCGGRVLACEAHLSPTEMPHRSGRTMRPPRPPHYAHRLSTAWPLPWGGTKHWRQSLSCCWTADSVPRQGKGYNLLDQGRTSAVRLWDKELAITTGTLVSSDDTWLIKGQNE